MLWRPSRTLRRADRPGAPAPVRRLVAAQGQGRTRRGAAGHRGPRGRRGDRLSGRHRPVPDNGVATRSTAARRRCSTSPPGGSAGSFTPEQGGRRAGVAADRPGRRAADLRVRPGGARAPSPSSRPALSGVRAGAARQGRAPGVLRRRRRRAAAGRQGAAAGRGAGRSNCGRSRRRGAQRAAGALPGDGRAAGRVALGRTVTSSRCWPRTPTGTTRPGPGAGWSNWRRASADGGAVVVCSQGGVIPGVVKSLAGRSDVPIGEVSTPKAAYWLLSFDGRRLVQADSVSGAGRSEHRPAVPTGTIRRVPAARTELPPDRVDRRRADCRRALLLLRRLRPSWRRWRGWCAGLAALAAAFGGGRLRAAGAAFGCGRPRRPGGGGLGGAGAPSSRPLPWSRVGLRRRAPRPAWRPRPGSAVPRRPRALARGGRPRRPGGRCALAAAVAAAGALARRPRPRARWSACRSPWAASPCRR